jgi:uncharacterized membrane protein
LAAAGTALLAAALFFRKEDCAVSRIYAVLYLVLSAAYLCALPLFHVSDEQQHFLRAYTIASGRLLPERISEKDVGAYLPDNLIPEELGKAGEISWKDLRGGLGEKIVRNEPRAYFFPCTALYSPVSYLPQAFGIRIADWATDRPVVIAYAGRVSNLLAGLLLTYSALKWMPFGKETMLLLLLAPIQMHKVASLSADGFTIAVVMLLAAYTLHLQYGKTEKLREREVVFLYILAFLVSQCKIVCPGLLSLVSAFAGAFRSRRRYFPQWRHGALPPRQALAGSYFLRRVSCRRISGQRGNRCAIPFMIRRLSTEGSSALGDTASRSDGGDMDINGIGDRI